MVGYIVDNLVKQCWTISSTNTHAVWSGKARNSGKVLLLLSIVQSRHVHAETNQGVHGSGVLRFDYFLRDAIGLKDAGNAIDSDWTTEQLSSIRAKGMQRSCFDNRPVKVVDQLVLCLSFGLVTSFHDSLVFAI